MKTSSQDKVKKKPPKWLSLEHMELLRLAQLGNQRLVAQELGVSNGRVSQMIGEIETLLGEIGGGTKVKVFAKGDDSRNRQSSEFDKSILTTNGELIRKAAMEVLAKADEFNRLVLSLGLSHKPSDELTFMVACCDVNEQLLETWFDLFPNQANARSTARVLDHEGTDNGCDQFQIVDRILLSPKQGNPYSEQTIGRVNLLVWGPKNKSGFPGCLNNELFYIPSTKSVFSSVLSKYFTHVGVAPRFVENSCDKTLLRQMAVTSGAFFAVRSDDASADQEEFFNLMEAKDYRPIGICEDALIETKLIIKDRELGEFCKETFDAYCLEYSRKYMSTFAAVEKSRKGYRVIKDVPKES